MEKIIYYETNNGLYFASDDFGYSGRKNIDISNRLFDGFVAENTFNKAWYFIPSKALTKVTQLKKGTRINKRYILKDETLCSDKIPLKLSTEQVKEIYDDDEYAWLWTNDEYKHLRSLYEEEYDYTEDEWVDVDTEIRCLGKVEKQGEPDNLIVKVLNDPAWNHKGTKEIDLSSIVRWDELYSMVTPEFLLHKTPCSLSSRQTYEIIRQYVKDNIDPKLAVVTSDYAFCFTVKNKIAIKPYTKKWELKKANGKPYARPKIKTKNIEYKEVEIFEMTHKEENYRGYTPIDGFKGDSLEDLIENLKLYLEELMDYINMPLKECDCCSGTGHILEKKRYE